MYSSATYFDNCDEYLFFVYYCQSRFVVLLQLLNHISMCTVCIIYENLFLDYDICTLLYFAFN